MAGQGPARRRRASRLHPVRIAVLTLFCLLLSGTAGAAAYFFPVVVAGVGQTTPTAVVPPTLRPAHPQPRRERHPHARGRPGRAVHGPAARVRRRWEEQIAVDPVDDPGTGRAHTTN